MLHLRSSQAVALKGGRSFQSQSSKLKLGQTTRTTVAHCSPQYHGNSAQLISSKRSSVTLLDEIPFPSEPACAHVVQELPTVDLGMVSATTGTSQILNRFQPEFNDLLAQLSSGEDDHKLEALTRIIDSAILKDAMQLQEGERLPQLLQCLGKLLSSWVTGGLEVAALAAEALCRLMAMDVESCELEAGVRTCLRPLLQLLSSCSQPKAEDGTLPAAFFAASAVVRATAWPSAVEEVVSQGGVAVLAALLQPAQEQLFQVAVFALFKLKNSASDPEDVLTQLAEAGGFHVLCEVLVASTSDSPAAATAAEMAFALLLEMAAVSRVRHIALSSGAVGTIVRALHQADCSNQRLKVVLVMCRLACHNTTCQLFFVREGCVPILVDMMEAGEAAERAHAARLAAILAQHPAAHDMFRSSSVMRPVVGMLRSGDPTLSEQAASVAAVMVHNTSTHFHMIAHGLVPAMLTALDNGTDKGKGYVLSTILLLVMNETRHSAAMVREGLVPRLVTLAREEQDEGVQEYAAAVIGQLCRNVDMQQEVVTAGGIPALVRLVRASSADGRGHAAEALAHLASPSAVRKRLIARSGVWQPLAHALMAPHPTSQYWACSLLQVLSQEPSVLAQMAGQGMCVPLVALLSMKGGGAASAAEQLQAKAQACWVLVRLASSPGASAALRHAQPVRPLMTLLGQVQPHAAETELKPSIQIEGLEHNTHAAAMAALLALRSSCDNVAMEILEEAVLQLWCGRTIRLHGLTADYVV